MTPKDFITQLAGILERNAEPPNAGMPFSEYVIATHKHDLINALREMAATIEDSPTPAPPGSAEAWGPNRSQTYKLGLTARRLGIIKETELAQIILGSALFQPARVNHVWQVVP